MEILIIHHNFTWSHPWRENILLQPPSVRPCNLNHRIIDQNPPFLDWDMKPQVSWSNPKCNFQLTDSSNSLEWTVPTTKNIRSFYPEPLIDSFSTSNLTHSKLSRNRHGLWPRIIAKQLLVSQQGKRSSQHNVDTWFRLCKESTFSQRNKNPSNLHINCKRNM